LRLVERYQSPNACSKMQLTVKHIHYFLVMKLAAAQNTDCCMRLFNLTDGDTLKTLYGSRINPQAESFPNSVRCYCLRKHLSAQPYAHVQKLPCPQHLQISTTRISNEILANTHQRITIYGLGGCGKPTLTIKFTYRALAQHAGRLML
jgi:hypothetical protein